MQILQSKKSEIFNDKFSFVAGNKNSKIKIVEFIDYKCGYCKKNHAIIWSIIKSNPDVKYIAKEFPILGAQSRLAAQALLAILLEDTNEIYKNFSNLLISHSGTINISILKEFAVKSGSKIINLNNIMKSKKVNSLIANNMSLAQTLGIDGTPTFIIGEQIIRGFISKNEMQQLIEIIREKL